MLDKRTYFNDTRSFVTKSWDSLTRTLTRSETYGDPKTDDEPILYLPAEVPEPAAIRDLQLRCRVDVRRLPELVAIAGDVDLNKIENEGLLYLEHPYVVPGGQFNEMYGWDSYFIILGLLRDDRIGLAKGMVENFFFELDHYGAVLNANRTYYLTRSQPPFLTSMILTVYDAQKAAGNENRAWLEKAYDYAARDYGLWTHEPHLAGSTGLARYYDFGTGPAPESLKDETGHYGQVAAFFLAQPGMGRGVVVQKKPGQTSQPLVGPLFALQVCDTTGTMAR